MVTTVKYISLAVLTVVIKLCEHTRHITMISITKYDVELALALML